MKTASQRPKSKCRLYLKEEKTALHVTNLLTGWGFFPPEMTSDLKPSNELNSTILKDTFSHLLSCIKLDQMRRLLSLSCTLVCL